MDFTYSVAGAFVGFLVGLTGVGGGSVMAPLLILLFGVSPALAIGTDLWFAAITKSAGGLVHHRLGSLNWKIASCLAMGSIPAAVLTVLWLGMAQGGSLESDLLMRILGVALLVTAMLMLAKNRMARPMRYLRGRFGPALHSRQVAATVVGGVVVGCLVTLTSVGAGSLVAVLLALLYPLRLGAKAIVGTDIIHAVPLTLIAALGHSWLGNTDVWLLGSLLLGSIPGIILGSLATGRINENLVRYALALMLTISAIKMIAT